MLDQKDIKKLKNASSEILLNNKLTPIFSALSDENRYKIYSLLFFSDELCVTDIATILNVSLPLTSQHLRILAETGLVHKERMGQMMCYMLDYKHPFNIHMKKILKIEN